VRELVSSERGKLKEVDINSPYGSFHKQKKGRARGARKGGRGTVLLVGHGKNSTKKKEKPRKAGLEENAAKDE